MKIAVTGHRPNKLGGYSIEAEKRLFSFISNFIADKYFDLEVTFITGMALGFDQAVAEACLYLNFPYISAIPCLFQHSSWSYEKQQQYHKLVSRASEVIQVSNKPYTNTCMQERNMWMVDHCDQLLALYNGNVTGGTAHCVKYAESKGIPILNIWDDWVNYQLGE